MDQPSTKCPAQAGGQARRRAAFALLVGTSTAAALAGLSALLPGDATGVLDFAILACFAVTLPWNLINFWNALIGLALLLGSRDPLAAVLPVLRELDDDAPLRGRTAILMPIHNEEPERVFRHLQAIVASLDATGEAAGFEVFLLSDTQDAAIAARETKLFAAWRSADGCPSRLHYRRRFHNDGAKTGNLWEFIDSADDGFDYILVLDADSLMSGPAITRLARVMDTDPQLGILQPLISGLPSGSAFARIFQFGMRHGMRTYAMGGAWWQGDCGPYWGHNAIIRLQPFRAHCRLPLLPGRPPFGGRILSHDQVEAVLMRRAGYAVRVLPDESGSFEANPPTLTDFLGRDLRWCQGNMQYARLLLQPGLPAMGRLQLLLAMLMYLQAPAWLLFIGLGLLRGLLASPHLRPAAGSAGIGSALFVAALALVFAPKLAGVLQAMARSAARRSYGGGPRLLAGAVCELGFSLLMAPMMTVLHSRFILGMLCGRTVIWTAQRRDARLLDLREALRRLWLPPLVATVLIGGTWLAAPAALPWLLPLVTGMLLAPLFAWVTAFPGLGARLARARLCAVPEEFTSPLLLQAAGYGAATARPRAKRARSVLRAMTPVRYRERRRAA